MVSSGSNIKRVLDDGIEGRVYTCYAYSVVNEDGPVESGWGGLTGDSKGEPVDDATMFDLASLTKPILTATVLAQLVSEGKVRLDHRVSRYLVSFDHSQVDPHVGALLNHTSGLPAHIHLYRWARNLDEAIRYIARLEPEYEPGTKEVYSDLGYIVLGKIVEQATGATLEKIGWEKVFAPLAMNQTMFKPDPNRYSIALTERYTDRPYGPGLVHDENCFFLGGVCGHAGLFSCLRDLEKYASGLLSRDRRVFTDTSYRLFLDKSNISIGGEHSYGWFIKSPNSSFFVDKFSGDSIGHTGFTGTGIWFDLERNHCAVLLTNRVYFGRDPEGIRRVRAKFNSEAWVTSASRIHGP